MGPYCQGAEHPEDSSNQRDGKAAKQCGPLRLDNRWDRAPILSSKHEHCFTGFYDEIRALLSEQYGTEVSHDFISSVTDGVLEEVNAWQQRPLEPMYPVIFVDALRVKNRDEGLVRNKAIYMVLGVFPDSTRDVLAIWTETTEGTRF